MPTSNEVSVLAVLCCSACESTAGTADVQNAEDAFGTDGSPLQDAVEHVASDAAEVKDPCPVLDDQRCGDGCVPIYSVHVEGVECSLDGVFMGCSEPPHGVVSLDVADICSVLRSDPEHRYYCVEDDLGARWFYDHIALFCASDPPCPGEPMPGCMN